MNPIIRWLLLCLLWMIPAKAAKLTQQTDLTAGIVLPSNGFAIFENPAALGRFSKGGLVDVQALLNGNPDYQGAISSKLGRTVGAAIGFQRLFDTLNLTPGLGFSLGRKFSLGISTNVTIGSTYTEQFQIGLLYQPKRNPILGIVFDDAFNFNSWTLGIAWAGKVGFELDFSFTRSSGFNITTVNGLAALLLMASKKVTALIRYRFELIPTIGVTGGQRFELGLSVWVSKGVAFYGLYNNSLTRYILGARIRF